MVLKRIVYSLIIVLLYIVFQFFAIIHTPANWKTIPMVEGGSLLPMKGGYYTMNENYKDSVEDLFVNGFSYVKKSLRGNSMSFEKTETRFPFKKHSKLHINKLQISLDGRSIAEINIRNDIWFLNLNLCKGGEPLGYGAGTSMRVAIDNIIGDSTDGIGKESGSIFTDEPTMKLRIASSNLKIGS